MELHHLKLIQMPPMERVSLGRKAIRSIKKGKWKKKKNDGKCFQCKCDSHLIRNCLLYLAALENNNKINEFKNE